MTYIINVKLSVKGTRVCLNVKISNKELSKFDIFKLLGNYNHYTNQTRIVNVDELVGQFSSLALGNGGSWCRPSNCKNFKVATMKKNGKINILWSASDIEIARVTNEFNKNCKISETGNNIQYIKIFGLKENDTGRPIRKDIIDFYKKVPCCACGKFSDLVCDHKNDLYNDKRVLDAKTQTVDDFQSLCNQCNLQKRQVSKKAKETGQRYSAQNIPCLSVYGVDFISGGFEFDISDVNAMVGTYWYDPIAFHKGIIKNLVYSKSL